MINIIFVYSLISLVGYGLYTYQAQHMGKSRSVLSRLVAYLSSFKESSMAARNAKMLEAINAEIYDRNQVVQKFDTDTWQRLAFESFAATLTSKNTFPCIYGTKGFKANELDFLFLDSENLTQPEITSYAAKGIQTYHRGAGARGKSSSLVIMTPPPTETRSIEEYQSLFWAFLRRLRKLDPKPWPQHIPKDTSDRFWCSSFDNTEAFIVVLTPAHKQRLSRHCANLCMVYQPRWVFDNLFTSEKVRKAATTTVRNLVDKYDRIPRSPDVDDYGLPNTTESRQYFLLDKNETAFCPYPSLDEV